MNCQVIKYKNDHNNKLIVHNTFLLTENKTMIPEKYTNYYENTTVDGVPKKVFIDYNKKSNLKEMNMTIHRTDSNK